MTAAGKQIILLVEDNEGDAVLAREALKYNNSDSKIVHVLNGEQAFEILFGKSFEKPDLVLLDLNLPGLSGIEILKILKGSSLTRDIPVIVLSTSDSEKDRNICLSLEADKYITKPISLNDFFMVYKEIDDYITGLIKIGDK